VGGQAAGDLCVSNALRVGAVLSGVALAALAQMLALGMTEIGVALRQGDPALLVAVDDGTPLVDIGFGGADLLVDVIALSAAVPPEAVLRSDEEFDTERARPA